MMKTSLPVTMAIPITSPDPEAVPIIDQVLGTGGWFKIFTAGPVIGAAAVWIFIASALALILCIIWSGYQWLTAREDAKSLQAAKTRLMNCLIGLSIISLAAALINLIQTFFGITIFGP